MIGFIRGLFYPMPKPGDVFIWDDWLNKDPWRKPEEYIVLEVKNGWIRYEGVNETRPRTCDKRSFNLNYKRKPIAT
jgi:hypothetical protein